VPASVFIGLGSNLNQPIQQVLQAIEAINVLPTSHIDATSSLYETPPLGPQNQPHYINAVAKLSTDLKPLELLDQLQSIEQQHNRTRDTGRWGARTLDLDILLYDNQESNDPTLTLPHPELQNRSFVLHPLLEIAPQLNIPSLGSIKQLVKKLGEPVPTIIKSKKLDKPSSVC